ncbi:MAG: PRC-barrel domain-containing protein [Ideonella sp.]|nr:PRC-barrel domain-containing protein [Ideonella sp.]
MNGDFLASSRIVGATVHAADGARLGTVTLLLVDRHTGRVAAAVVEPGGFFGMASDRYALAWHLLRQDETGDGYTVPLTASDVARGPRYGGHPDGSG